jgi:hypothetical protein
MKFLRFAKGFTKMEQATIIQATLHSTPKPNGNNITEEWSDATFLSVWTEQRKETDINEGGQGLFFGRWRKMRPDVVYWIQLAPYTVQRRILLYTTMKLGFARNVRNLLTSSATLLRGQRCR